jgi:hypothetical protein
MALVFSIYLGLFLPNQNKPILLFNSNSEAKEPNNLKTEKWNLKIPILPLYHPILLILQIIIIIPRIIIINSITIPNLLSPQIPPMYFVIIVANMATCPINVIHLSPV